MTTVNVIFCSQIKKLEKSVFLRSPPTRRNICCITIILVIDVVTVLAMGFLVLKYHWAMRMKYPATTTLADQTVLKKTRVRR